MMNNYFEVLKKDAGSYARIGRINSPRGIIETPVFMPVGTKASVKAVLKEQLDDMGCMIILSNLYHIYLSPGIEIIKKAGGIHKFSSWSRSILTDSGGFQVFSLSDIRKIKDDGVEFKSIIDGSSHFFTPEKVIKMQLDIGSDIMMVLDECSIFNADERVVAEAAGRTLKWARQSIKAYNIFRNNDNSRIFGIVQGGFNRNLRKYCAQSVSEMDFDGIALGGLSVGESRDITTEMMGYTSQFTDRRKPLYVMGLGDPVGILNGINFGVDMFDCVLPTRISRTLTVVVPTATTLPPFFIECSIFLTFAAAALEKISRCIVSLSPIADGFEWLQNNWSRNRGVKKFREFLDVLEEDNRRQAVYGRSNLVKMKDALNYEQRYLDLIDVLKNRFTDHEFTYYVELASVNSIIQLRPIDVVDRISPKPILLMAGKKDKIVPWEEHAGLLFEKAGDIKKLEVFEHGEHGLLAEPTKAEALTCIIKWYKKYL
jgi:queuine tRNA-ribosyltransferase